MSNFNYLKKFENFIDSEYYNTLTQEEFFNIVNKNTIIDIDSNLKDIIESRLKHKSSYFLIILLNSLKKE
jgi:hypothetical protein